MAVALLKRIGQHVQQFYVLKRINTTYRHINKMTKKSFFFVFFLSLSGSVSDTSLIPFYIKIEKHARAPRTATVQTRFFAAFIFFCFIAAATATIITSQRFVFLCDFIFHSVVSQPHTLCFFGKNSDIYAGATTFILFSAYLKPNSFPRFYELPLFNCSMHRIAYRFIDA